MSIAATSPRLMVGVPTGYLSPQIPPPSQFVTTVGIEVEPGLGISIDGKAILVGPQDANEKVEILGRLEDGTYPQRDFLVTRQGLQSVVDGYYNHQDYKLDQKGNHLYVKGETDVESFTADYRANGFDINSKYSGRTYKVDVDGANATVKPAWQEGRQYQIEQRGNTTFVDGGHEDINFSFTRNSDGSITIDGKYAYNDFTIKEENGNLVLKGHYPQQKFVIKHTPA